MKNVHDADVKWFDLSRGVYALKHNLPHTPRCIEHECLCTRVDKHDAYFCPECMKWVEATCKSPHCDFCLDRPEVPEKY